MPPATRNIQLHVAADGVTVDQVGFAEGQGGALGQTLAHLSKLPPRVVAELAKYAGLDGS